MASALVWRVHQEEVSLPVAERKVVKSLPFRMKKDTRDSHRLVTI